MQEIEQPVIDNYTIMRQVIPQLNSNPQMILLGYSKWPVVDKKLAKQGLLQKVKFLYGEPGKEPRTVQYYIDFNTCKLVHSGVGGGFPVLSLKDLHPLVSEMLGFQFN